MEFLRHVIVYHEHFFASSLDRNIPQNSLALVLPFSFRRWHNCSRSSVSLVRLSQHRPAAKMAPSGPEGDQIKTEQGVTAQLSQWISNLQLSDIPPAVRERAKYQLLDGVACALVGAHVPWSEKYVQATAEYEPAGEYSVIGWDKVSPTNLQ